MLKRGGTQLKPFAHLAAAVALAGSLQAVDAQAQVSGYVTDTRGAVATDAFGLCWRTGYWTPAMATAQCDPDLAPKPAPKPAARPAPPPAARPAAPAPAARPPAPPKPVAAKPAPPKRCDANVVLVADQLFAFGSRTINNAAKARLDKDVVGRIATCATLESVVIEGHTDRLGSQQFNQKLSERRADAVKAYLVSKGIAKDKIETIGMGKTVPAKFCPDSKNRKELIACLAPNRRVAVSIKGPAK
ncbi:MAG: OmpA family protein [Betaproteobacteria bacterium]|nr:OmpA family protein [Betaproteobacteria bacterium]